MKTYNSVLCIVAGIIAAVLFVGGMFKSLQWPGGSALLMCGVLSLLIFNCFAFAGICKYSALNDFASKGVKGAKQVRNSLIALVVAIMVLCLGVIFRFLHWPGAAWLLLLGFSASAIIALLLGIFAGLFIKNKE